MSSFPLRICANIGFSAFHWPLWAKGSKVTCGTTGRELSSCSRWNGRRETKARFWPGIFYTCQRKDKVKIYTHSFEANRSGWKMKPGFAILAILLAAGCAHKPSIIIVDENLRSYEGNSPLVGKISSHRGRLQFVIENERGENLLSGDIDPRSPDIDIEFGSLPARPEEKQDKPCAFK